MNLQKTYATALCVSLKKNHIVKLSDFWHINLQNPTKQNGSTNMADFDSRFKSNTVEWATPREVFDPLNREFNFTLDVSATPENTKCPKFFTKEVDGLSQEWSGVCWMNPPYGKDVPKWLKKALEESKRGVTTVCLIPARTNTKWFHDLCLNLAEVRFVKGRPKFGDADHGLPLPLAVVIYRPRYGSVNM